MIMLALLLLLAAPLAARDDSEAQRVFSALNRAYPYYVSLAAGEPYPALRVRGKLFYWVEGRILPAEEWEKWESYAPHGFYDYPKTPLEPLDRSPELTLELEKTADDIRARRPSPSSHPALWSTLYDAATRMDMENHLITDRFLKRLVVVHRLAWGPLKKVEASILELAKTDESVRRYVASIDRVYTFHWRTVAKSASRSLHSYGVSVDTVDSKNKKPVYWLWQRIAAPKQWARQPLDRRWAPPEAVIRIFENHGFIWGGKWNLYDTIHFEYRPEILLLSGYEVSF